MRNQVWIRIGSVLLALMLLVACEREHAAKPGSSSDSGNAIRLDAAHPESRPADVPEHLAWGGLGGPGGDGGNRRENIRVAGWAPGETVRLLFFQDIESNLVFLAERHLAADPQGGLSIELDRQGDDYLLHLVAVGATGRIMHFNDLFREPDSLQREHFDAFYYDPVKGEGIPAFAGP